jgi:hypothetical protein
MEVEAETETEGLPPCPRNATASIEDASDDKLKEAKEEIRHRPDTQNS